MIAIILHNFQDLYLMSSEASAVAVDEIPKEIHKFAFVVAIFGFVFDMLTNIFDKFEDSKLLVEHSLIVIVHFL
jgi:hypothetical protein